MRTNARSRSAAALLTLLLPLTTPAAAAQGEIGQKEAEQTGATEPTARAPQATDPWAALAEVRRRLAAAGALGAQFEQTYLPAGFSQGETEHGRLALSLPDCLRWDYDEPYAKSFLVCGDTAYYWNPEDGTGRRQGIDSEREPGLDLLLLGVDALAQRYRATAQREGEAEVRIHLEPRSDTHPVRDAVLTLDTAGGRVMALEYSDREGNRSRFTLSAYAPLESLSAFTPPADIRWEEGS